MVKANTEKKRGGVRIVPNVRCRKSVRSQGHRYIEYIENNIREWDKTNEPWELCGERVREAKNKLEVL